MKDAFWLQHDSNAQHDERILELRAEYGWEGYGLFWALVERMRDAQGYRLAMGTMGGLATSMGLLKPKLVAVIELCCTHGLFAMEEGTAYVYAPSLRRRMEAWDGKKAALAEAGRRGVAAREARRAEATLAAEPSQDEATLKPPLSHPAQILSTVDNSRVEKKTEDNSSLRSDGSADAAPLPEKKIADEYSSQTKSTPASPADASHTEGGAADVGTSIELAAPPKMRATRGGQFQKPTRQQLVDYLAALPTPPPNPAALADRFLNHYDGVGWKIGRNPMKDWQATARNWASDNRPATATTTHRHATTQQPSGNRYNTTARGGFGGFAGPGAGSHVNQPVGGTGLGNPPTGTTGPTG